MYCKHFRVVFFVMSIVITNDFGFNNFIMPLMPMCMR